MEEKKPLRLSSSKINTFGICKLQYKYQYMDKIPSKPNEAMKKGSELHSIFEEFHKVFKETKSLPKGRRDLESKIEKSLMYKYPSEIENFIEFNYNLLKKTKENWQPIALEKKYYDEELDFVGVIDVVYKTDENVLLMDYKTGKHRSGYEKKYRNQLAGYTHLWDKNNPDLKITHWGIFFTVDGSLWTESVLPEELEKFHSTLKDTKKGIAKNVFDPNPSFMCNWCSFKKRCPA